MSGAAFSKVLGAGLVLALAALIFVLAKAGTSEPPGKTVLRPERPRATHEERAPSREAPARPPEAQPVPRERRAPEEAGPEAAEAPARTPSAPAPGALVKLFQHATHDPQFPGATWTVGFGLTDAGYAFGDDDASAVEVPEGLAVTLYEGTGGSGRRISLGAGLHNLAPVGFNDLVSSARVETEEVARLSAADEVVLYRDVVPEGGTHPGDWRFSLPRGTTRALFSAARGDFEAWTVSALSVPPGHEVTLFEQPDGRGIALVLGPGYHELEPAGFDDRASSLRLASSTKR